MVLNIKIIKASGNDHVVLSNIALSAKKHWNYPEEYYEKWKDELTITPEYITENIVYIAISQDIIIGFYSIVNVPEDFTSGEVLVKKGYWLEHIFIIPAYHKMGVGTLLMQHAIQFSKEMKISKLNIFVDPFAAGFYNKIGAKYAGESKSSIKDRMIPIYEIDIL